MTNKGQVFLDKRIHIITGHYGSGKSEISINLAMALSRQGKKVVLADMDIINPYFRSNEAKELMEDKGITVMTTKYANSNVDIPALTGELRFHLHDKNATLIIDVGGDDAGAKVVGSYSNEIPEQDANLYFVVNCFRPETTSLDGIRVILDEIQSAARMDVNYLINNGHLMSATTEQEVKKGIDFTKQVSHSTEIPIAFHAIMKNTPISSALLLDEPVFWMDKTMGVFNYSDK